MLPLLQSPDLGIRARGLALLGGLVQDRSKTSGSNPEVGDRKQRPIRKQRPHRTRKAEARKPKVLPTDSEVALMEGRGEACD